MTLMEVVNGNRITVVDKPLNSLELARELALAKELKNDDDAFAVLNLSDVYSRFTEWTTKMPRVQPFYAVKCNNDPVLLWMLAKLGCGFDCASRAEIDAVLGAKLVPPDHIIYANPCKTRSFIQHACQTGVRKMTFDSGEELEKVARLHERPQMILRIGVSDPTAICQLSVKFGCDPEKDGPRLLRHAKELGVDVVGVAFHVGSGCRDPVSFRRALSAARTLFDVGAECGHRMTIVDVGGGFPGYDSDEITFDQIVDVIRPALDDLFPASMPGLQVIAEPGRFFASMPMSLVANIIATVQVPAVRVNQAETDITKAGQMYYMNDGVYGSFNCILFDHQKPRGRPLFAHDEQGQLFDTTIWGPTCDGLDQVEVHTVLPKLDVGDWLYYPHMGAYTIVAGSRFNGFEPPKVYYFVHEDTWKDMNCAMQGA